MAQTKIRTSCRLALPFACAVVWASLSSCTADKSDADGGVSSGDCQQLMSVYCNKLAACDPVGLRRRFGDVETCTARQILACPTLTLAGTGWTSGQIQQCMAQINASTNCYEDTFGAEACDEVPGTLSAGTSCEQSSQCATQRCDRNTVLSPDGGRSEPACGVCSGGDAGPSNPGCGDGGACQSPERCVYDTNDRAQRCILPRPEGAPCTANGGCAEGLFCKRSTSDAGTSVCSKRGAAGAVCISSGECAGQAGLRCIAGVCNAPALVAVGAACNSEGRLCERDARCVYPSPLPPMATGVCQAPADDGSRCDTTTGPYCRDPASWREGICHLPGDAQCR